MSSCFSATALVLLLAFASVIAHASGQANQWLRLIAAGQYEQVIQQAEAVARPERLSASEVHMLCHAYARTKHYTRLEACLDRFETTFARADRESVLFGLDDAMPAILLMRAEAAIDLGRYDVAAREAQRALDWMARSGLEPLIAIDSHATLALAHAFRGDHAAARAQLEPIGRIGRSLFKDDYKTTRALAQGRVYMALGEYRLAYDAVSSDRTFKLDAFLDDLFSGALLRGESNWLWLELPRAYMLSRALLGMGEVDAAATRLDRLLAQPRARQNGEIYWMASFDRGRIAEQRGEDVEAARHYAHAVEMLEAQRASIATEANKIGFVGDKQQVYARLIRTLLRLGRERDAFEYVERSRARALVDLLAARQDWGPRARRDEVARLLQAQRSAEEAARRQMTGAPEPRDGAQTIARLREIDPEIASLVAVSTLSLAELQAMLAPDERLLAYHVDGGELLAFLVSARDLRVVRNAAGDLAHDIRGLRQAIADQAADVLPRAQVLYRRLLGPVEMGADVRKLYLVPHGPLHYLPFAALHDGQRHLVERVAFAILPSASLLRFLAPRRPDRAPAGALVLANPDLGSRRLDLPHAEQEARAIVAGMPGSTLLIRAEANETAFRVRAARHVWLHFATHGHFSAEQPLRSGLLLAADAENDGRLSVDELYGLALDAELVTLSACETGLGAVMSGDEVIGLIRGFLFAGARNVVASLWPVDDLATADLMRRFYAGLGTHEPAEALRSAQVAMLRAGRAPYFWAAFQSTGR